MSDIDVFKSEFFFPENMDYESYTIDQTHKKIVFTLRGSTPFIYCSSCGKKMTKIHASHIRKVKDLPVFDYSTTLHITVREFECENPLCSETSQSETFDGFLDEFAHRTKRCTDLIAVTTFESTGEGASRILKHNHIDVSPETCNRALVRAYLIQQETGEKPDLTWVGIDDFAFKKRFSYGTVFVDHKTHDIVDVIKGRDQESVEAWLSKHTGIRVVTRDRASAYSAAVDNILPDAMQIADRFHLGENQLKRLQKLINKELPNVIRIPRKTETETEASGDPDETENTESRNTDEISSNNDNTNSVSGEPEQKTPDITFDPSTEDADVYKKNHFSAE